MFRNRAEHTAPRPTLPLGRRPIRKRQQAGRARAGSDSTLVRQRRSPRADRAWKEAPPREPAGQRPVPRTLTRRERARGAGRTAPPPPPEAGRSAHDSTPSWIRAPGPDRPDDSTHARPPPQPGWPARSDWRQKPTRPSRPKSQRGAAVSGSQGKNTPGRNSPQVCR
jgi:hypothetical protein